MTPQTQSAPPDRIARCSPWLACLLGAAASVPWCVLEVLSWSGAPTALALGSSVLIGAALGGLWGLATGWVRRPWLLVLLLIAPGPALGASELSWALMRAVLLVPVWTTVAVWIVCLLGAALVGGGAFLGLRRALPEKQSWWWFGASAAGFAALAILIDPVQSAYFPVSVALIHVAAFGGFGLLLWKPLRLPLAVLLALCGASALWVLPDRYVGLQAILGAVCVGGGLLSGRMLWARRDGVDHPWSPRGVMASVVVVAVLLGASHGVLAARGGFWTLKEGGGGALSFWIRFGHNVSDLDRDGYGSVFIHRDCAPLDPQRHSGLHEIPGNGVDDNCQAGDAESGRGWLDARTAIHPRPGSWKGDVVLVVVDSLRADDALMPEWSAIQSFAREGVVFERAYSTAPFTSQAMMGHLGAMLPGGMEMVWVHPLNGHPAQPMVGLSTMLSEAGYDTGFAGGCLDSENQYFTRETYAHGFRSVSQVSYKKEADAVTDAALSVWEGLSKDKPRFLYTHYMSVHEYELGDRASYRESIRAFDASLARLAEGVGRDALWIITSDHGDEFGEHGGQAHASSLYEEQMKIPLIVSRPGLPARRVDAVTSSLALTPTVAAMVGPPWFPSGDQMVLCLDQPKCRDMPAPMALELRDVHLHGLVLGRRKVIRNLKTGVLAAFDLDADPSESAPILDVPEDLERALVGWEERVMGVRGERMVGGFD